MLRQRLVRQSALNISSSNESTNMASPPPLRRRRSSQDSKMYRRSSSDSLDNLLAATPPPCSIEERRSGGRRHSVACGVLYMDMQKPSFKSAFNSAVRRMSDACSLLSSAPSSTYNLSTSTQTQSAKKKQSEVILPQVLGTFHQNRLPAPTSSNEKIAWNNIQANRRFSTDCPPPSYKEVTGSWKQPAVRQKLTRQQEVVTSNASALVALEDGAFGIQDD